MKHLRLISLIGLVFVAVVLLVPHPTSLHANAERPNIIVIITDDQDADGPAVMRKLMANPYGHWLQFTQGFAGDSIGGVARVSLLTGQYTHHHGIIGNRQTGQLDDRNTLAVWLRDAGYYTALIGKYLNGYPWDKGAGYVPPGWNYFHYRGDKIVDSYSEETVEVLTDIIDNHGDKPFFLYLAHRAPQRPADPPARYEDADVSVVPKATSRPNFGEADMSDKPLWARKQPIPIPGGYPGQTINGYPGYMWDTNWILDEQRRSYRQQLAIDDSLEAMLDLLHDKGVLDDTVIFYLSDSGYSWGSHRRTGRGCPYEECSRTPFLVFYPSTPNSGGPRPYLIDRPVANVDIVASITQLTGLVPRRQPQDGISLLPLLTGNQPNSMSWRDVVLLENLRSPVYYGIRTRDWKYVEYPTGERELYDMVNDRYELENVANKPAYAERRATMASLLAAMLGNQTVYSIRGTVLNASGVGMGSVVIADGAGHMVTTAADGSYTLANLLAGTYTISATKSGTTFTPASRTVTLPPNATAQDFAASGPVGYTVKGTITKNGLPVANVTVSDGAGHSAVTNAQGRYALMDLPAGTYTLTPSKTGLFFIPTNLSVTVPPNQTGKNFKASGGFNITGRVTTPGGLAIPGVTVSIDGRSVVTSSTGLYRLSGLQPGTYTLTATKTGYTFTTLSPITVPPNATGKNFKGTKN